MIVDFFLALVIGFVIELIYFKVAIEYNIVDKPNVRSSHNYITIRGGGIIFPIVGMFFFVFNYDKGLLAFFIPLFLISIISFLDDIKDINSNLRLLIQSIAVIVVIFPFRASLPTYQWPIIFILFTGIINAYNFMDGINGITAFYSIVTIGTLLWMNSFMIQFLPPFIFISLLAALSVFSFFNVRRKARCFAGDVGSVSMAFIICFLLLTLSIKTKNMLWILFLGVYGIDTVFTLCCRLMRREPLFKAHRSHFYQFLTNEGGWKHVSTSCLYASIQFFLNVLVIISYQKNISFLAIAGLFAILIIYIIFRLRLESKYRLFTSY